MFISPDIGKRVIICDDNYNSNGKSKALKKKTRFNEDNKNNNDKNKSENCSKLESGKDLS